MHTFEIQVRKAHGKWATRYSTQHIADAYHLYRSTATFGAYRKRLLRNGIVMHTQVADLPWGL